MLISVAALCLTLASAAAPAPAHDPLLVSLQRKLDSLSTLSGRFEQSLESATLGRSRVERGKFSMKRPGLMRWEYESPERKLAIVDGVHTWLYLPDDAEAYRGSAAELKEAGAAALLLTGKARLTSGYTARRLAPGDLPAAGAAGTVAIELKSTGTSAEPVTLTLAIDAERLHIRMLVVTGEMQDRMVFRFHDLIENRPLEAALFRFEPPPGVEVIESP